MTPDQVSQLTPEQRTEAIAAHWTEILTLLGEDPTRSGLQKTPMRAAKALMHITSGYDQNTDAILRSAMFEHDGSQVVTVRGIEFYSMCEHHILPFYGTVSVAYVPDGQIVGLSKLARVVDACARRLQVQERLTGQIVKALDRVLGTRGVLAVCDAQHMCMKMRGVEKQQASTLTIDYSGVFCTDPALRAEVLQALATPVKF